MSVKPNQAYIAYFVSYDGEKTGVNSIFLPCYLNGYKFSKYCLSLPHHYEKTARGIVKYLSGPCRKLQYEEIDIYMFSIRLAWAELCSFLWSVYYIRNAVRFWAATYFLRHMWRHINYRYKRVRISRRGRLRFKNIHRHLHQAYGWKRLRRRV